MKPVNIPDPCSENWNAMTPKHEGRFCASCTKVVVDFRQMSDDQIVDYLKQRSGERVCGRFRESQVNTPEKTKKFGFRVIRFAAAAFLVFGTFLFSGISMKAGFAPIGKSDTSKKKHKQDSIARIKQEREVMGKPAPPKERELMGDVAVEPK